SAVSPRRMHALDRSGGGISWGCPPSVRSYRRRRPSMAPRSGERRDVSPPVRWLTGGLTSRRSPASSKDAVLPAMDYFRHFLDCQRLFHHDLPLVGRQTLLDDLVAFGEGGRERILDDRIPRSSPGRAPGSP